MNNISKAIKTSIRNLKPLTYAYLTQNFKESEIREMELDCKDQLDILNVAVDGRVTKELGLSQFNAMCIQRILKTNLEAIKNCFKQIHGLEAQELTTIEKKLFKFDINQN